MSSFKRNLKDLIHNSDLFDYDREEKFTRRKKNKKNKNGKDKKKWRQIRKEKRGYDE